jgi:hypothetical protein
MLRAYCLISPNSPHTLPRLWVWEQLYIEHLPKNARIWRRFHLSKPLYQPWAT